MTRCPECQGRGYLRPCPCCEIGLEFVDSERPVANSEIYDVLSARGKRYVAFTMTPLFLMLWAANIGYTIEIDDDEVTLRDARGRIEYLAWPQHEDTMTDYPRDAAVEMASWM